MVDLPTGVNVTPGRNRARNGNGAKALPTTNELPDGVRSVLQILFQAQTYAQTLKRDFWDFALELPNLCATGISINDLRWLVCMGYVKHAEEISSRRKHRRAFRSYLRLTFTQRTCFVLTPEGLELACEIHDSDGWKLRTSKSIESMISAKGSDSRSTISVRDHCSLADSPYRLSPHWDHDRRELRLGGVLIKQYKLPSPNQEAILAAFEEEGWPTRIDDPLPPVFDLVPKRRLHDTIKSLNRRQKSRRLRFMGDGRGEGVVWEPIIAG